jgi:hypothetical protein
MNLLEEVDNSGNVLARYTQGASVDEQLSELRSNTTSYYEADGLASITSLSNGAGVLASTYTYDSFGKLTASTGTVTNPFRFTGRPGAVCMHLVLGIRSRCSVDVGRLRDDETEELATRRQILSLHGELPSHQCGFRRCYRCQSNQFFQNRSELKNQRAQRLAK